MDDKEMERQNFLNLVLMVTSFLVAIAAAEFVAKEIINIPSYGSFYERYSIDGCPSYVIGYATDDKTMPYSLKPNFSHILADDAWHPLPYKVTLDDFGFRNQSKKHELYDRLIVGDSVAFGIGVDDNETISAVLAEQENEKIYNLSIPGAGPAMYVKMIDQFLKHKKTKKIAILFYDGNDNYNFADACWNNGDLNSLLSETLYRKDISESPSHPAAFIFKNILLKNSSLFFLIYEQCFMHRSVEILSKEKKNLSANNKEKEIEDKKNSALKYLQELLGANCVEINTQKNISDIIKKIENNEYDDLDFLIKDVAKRLIEKECYPIGEEKVNLVSYSHWSVYSLFNLSTNNRFNVTSPKENKKFLSCQGKFKNNMKKKINIFLQYLSLLKKNGYKIELIILPAEYRLNRYADQLNQYPLCESAALYGIPCYNLIPKIHKYYQVNGNNALYLDGAHFNKSGCKQVASWIGQLKR